MSKVTPASACCCTCGLHKGQLGAGGEPQQGQAPSQVRWVNSPSSSQDSEEVSEKSESITLLRVRVRALEKYKTNYELLCSQLSQLNDQVGLQLQRHESDVEALQAMIEELRASKSELERGLAESRAQVASQQEIIKQDREYSDRVHGQLSAAAELLKATEKRVESKEQQLLDEIDELTKQLATRRQETGVLQAANDKLQQELGSVKLEQSCRLDQEAKKHEEARLKLKRQLESATAKLELANDQLKKHRTTSRESSRQIGHLKTENTALRQQLSNVQLDAEHLVSILDSQRADHEEDKHKLINLRKVNKRQDSKIASMATEIEGLHAEVMASKEALVAANIALESGQADLKHAKIELLEQSHELQRLRGNNESLTKQLNDLDQVKAQIELNANEDHRKHEEKCRHEVHQMRKLLAENQHRAAASSRDVEQLKKELEHVQQLLRSCKSEGVARVRPMSEPSSPPSTDDSADHEFWRSMLLQSGKAEESVLKSAIMEQVRAFSA